MSRKENLILTYASGPTVESDTFWVFIKSAKFDNADIVILTHDMKINHRNLLSKLGIEIVDVPAGEMYYLFRDRHLHFWNYLNEHGSNYNRVIVTDSRDVVFQSNPFDWKNEKNHFVTFMAEGFKRSESGFACIEHFEFQRDVPQPHLKENSDRWVCNAGVIFGTSRAIQDFEFLMFSVTMKTIGRCTDQAALNYLLHFLERDPAYQISFPQAENLCLTGEGIKQGSVCPVVKDDTVCAPNGLPYHIIHQWDRIDGLKEDILSKYS